MLRIFTNALCLLALSSGIVRAMEPSEKDIDWIISAVQNGEFDRERAQFFSELIRRCQDPKKRLRMKAEEKKRREILRSLVRDPKGNWPEIKEEVHAFNEYAERLYEKCEKRLYCNQVV